MSAPVVAAATALLLALAGGGQELLSVDVAARGRAALPAAHEPVPPVAEPRQSESAVASGSAVSVAASATAPAVGTAAAAPAAAHPVPALVEYLRAEVCGVSKSVAGGVSPCPAGQRLDHSDVCGAAPAVLPLWRHTRSSVLDDWGPWVLLSDVTCGGSPQPTGDQVLTAFRQLPIAPSVLHVQPDRGWVLVNAPTIVYADAGPQQLSTTLLGVQVFFTVTAQSYTWDFGEHVMTTTSAGHPYPHEDVDYAYRHLGPAGVRLLTTWQATYSTSVDPTVRPVPGTATTTSIGPQLQVIEARSHLTRGTCLQHPQDPGC